MSVDADLPPRLIEGAGTSDAAWQAWPGLANLPVISPRELVPKATGRLVVVAPHPDDELLACSGLLQMVMSEAQPSVLLAVTDGDASHPGSTAWPRERLSRERPLESARALADLGLTGLDIERAGLPDGAVAEHEAFLIEWLAERIGPRDVVLATWRLDGHPDHEASGRAAAAACLVRGARLIEAPIWAWHWAEPGDPRLPWQRARKLTLPPEVLDRKRRALSCCRSQIEPDESTGRPPILPATTLSRLLHPYEIYFP